MGRYLNISQLFFEDDRYLDINLFVQNNKVSQKDEPIQFHKNIIKYAYRMLNRSIGHEKIYCFRLRLGPTKLFDKVIWHLVNTCPQSHNTLANWSIPIVHGIVNAPNQLSFNKIAFHDGTTTMKHLHSLKIHISLFCDQIFHELFISQNFQQCIH